MKIPVLILLAVMGIMLALKMIKRRNYKNPDWVPTADSRESCGEADTGKLAEECWEKYLESIQLEYESGEYVKAFSGKSILYYTQRLLGDIREEEKNSLISARSCMARIEAALCVLRRNLEKKAEAPITREAFFKNYAGENTALRLQKIIRETGERKERIKSLKKPAFYRELYEATEEIYMRLAKICRREDCSFEEIKREAEYLKEILEEKGISAVFPSEIDSSLFDAAFEAEAEEAVMPAFIRKDNGEIVMKGNSVQR